MKKVLFVCLGNICRSPAAEGVMMHKLREKGLTGDYQIDSAGTSSYHIGEPPDSRMTFAARQRGIELNSQARRFLENDFDEFDHILVMDHENLEDVSLLGGGDELKKVNLLREFDPASNGDLNVPDPYFGGAQGFDDVLDILDRSVENLIDFLERQN